MIGRYAIDGVLGRGGASTVYAATDRLLGRPVAVKIFTDRADSTEHLREQEAEARLVARLNHPGLTTLLDAGVEVEGDAPPQLYLVMERVAGLDLRQRLRLGPLTPLQVAYIGFDLALGLEHVHQAGYLHRDIKPANVLLDERTDTRIRGKLTDFGISTVIGASQGEFTTGTAAYLGPEQVEGHDATAATDTYSLGIVLLEALTAHVAFPGTVASSAFARLDHAPDIPTTIPTGLTEIIRAMTARDPAARAQLPTVVAALQAYIASELASSTSPHRGRSEPATTAVRDDIAADTPDSISDRIARLARQVTAADFAAVLVNDGTALIPRSVDGYGIWPNRIPLDDPAAALLLSTTAPFAIADLRADPRTARTRLTDHAAIRSLAAAPLLSADSTIAGAIAATTTATRIPTSDQLDALAHLAALLVHDYDIRTAARRALFRT